MPLNKETKSIYWSNSFGARIESLSLEPIVEQKNSVVNLLFLFGKIYQFWS